MKKLVVIFSLFLASSLFQSCSLDECVEGKTRAPKLPTSAMMSIPNSAFASFDQSNTEGNFTGGTYVNYLHSVFSLLAWNSVVTVHMSLPTAAFQAAIGTDPVAINDTTFEWAYTFESDNNQGNDSYDIRLTAEIAPEGDRVFWRMLASKKNGFENFEWYTGYTMLDETETSFTLNTAPENPNPYIQLDFRNTGVDRSIQLTNVIPDDVNNGDFIKYSEMENNSLNRQFELRADSEDDMTIQYNNQAGYGRVMHEKFYNDTQYHCWDSQAKDIDCQ